MIEGCVGTVEITIMANLNEMMMLIVFFGMGIQDTGVQTPTQKY